MDDEGRTAACTPAAQDESTARGTQATREARDDQTAQPDGWLGEQAAIAMSELGRRPRDGLTALARMAVPTREQAQQYTRNLWWDGRLAVTKLTSSAVTVHNVYKFEELVLLLLGADGIERPLLDNSKLVMNTVDPQELLVWVRDQVGDDELYEAIAELLADSQGRHDDTIAIRRCLGRRWHQYRQALGMETGYVQPDDPQDDEHLHRLPDAADEAGARAHRPLGPSGRKADFPLLVDRPEDGYKAPVYLDSAATSQKPQTVLDAMTSYYATANGNPYRSIYPLSTYAERLYGAAREQVASFVNATYAEEIVFTSGATASLNMVAWSWGLDNLRPGDEILLSVAEHHSNIVPWQQVAALRGATLVWLYPDERGVIAPEQVEAKVSRHTKVVAIAHASNVLGIVNPVGRIAQIAHAAGAIVVLDAAQSVAHIPVNVRDLDVDFLAFSGHKVYGPTGIGVLYGKLDLLRALRPLLSGGGMIRTVDEEGATWAPLPRRLEAGTPDVAGAVGLGQAIGYLRDLGMDAVQAHERRLLAHALEGMSHVPGLTVYGRADEGVERCGLVSFNVGGIHAEDVARGMARQGVCVKSGNHCAQPLMRYLGVTSTCRVSVSVANSLQDVDDFLNSLQTSLRSLGTFLSDSVGG